MNKTTEALKLAEAYIAGMKWSEEADEALAAIREARAEQEKQEPVAWATKISKAFFNSPANGVFQVSHLMRDEYSVPLYAAPVSAKREWVELTDYEIVRLYAESPMCDSEMIAFARAVIAAFKEKNK